MGKGVKDSRIQVVVSFLYILFGSFCCFVFCFLSFVFLFLFLFLLFLYLIFYII